MAILDSVNELAKRFGVETEEQTISEQIDAINQKLDESYTGSRDIEEAVSKFAKNDGPDARLGTKTITENDTYIALDDELDGYSSVTVNVAAPTPETHQVTLTFTAENSWSFNSSETFSDIVDIINNGDIIDFTINMTLQGTTYTYSSVAYKYDTSSKIIKILGDLYSEEYSKYSYFVVYWGDPSVYESQTIAEDESGVLTVM